MERLLVLLRRIFFYLITAWIALTLNFFLPRMMPGNAVESVLAREQRIDDELARSFPASDPPSRVQGTASVRY